jgi:hypothetical protein
MEFDSEMVAIRVAAGPHFGTGTSVMASELLTNHEHGKTAQRFGSMAECPTPRRVSGNDCPDVRRLFEKLHEEICRTKREFSLLLLDLDGLKR